jgi:hypothetical protein
MLLESLWLGAWLRWLATILAGDLRPVGPLALILSGWLAFLLVRTLLALRFEFAAARAIALLAAGFGYLLVARAMLFSSSAWPLLDGAWLIQLGRELLRSPGEPNSAGLLAVTLVWIWWRGARYASQPITSLRVRRAVYGSLLALLVLGGLAAMGPPLALAGWIYASMASALVALALAKLEEASRDFGGSGADFGPTWLLIVASTTTALVGAVALLASLVSPEAAAGLARALLPLTAPIKRLLLLAVLVVGAVGGRLAEWLSALLRRWLDADRFADFLAEAGQRLGEVPGSGGAAAAEVAAQPLWLVNGSRLILLFLLVLLAAHLLSRTLRRYLVDRDPQAVVGEAEGGLSAARLGADLLASLRGLAAAAGVAGRSLWPRRTGLRGLYQELLGLMAQRDRARQPSQTPDEFRRVPAEAFPEATADVDELTEAYVALRYGEREPEPAELQRLHAAWRRIRAAARRDG